MELNAQESKQNIVISHYTNAGMIQLLEKMIKFAKRLKKQDLSRLGRHSSISNVLQRAISLSLGTINTMRPAAALNIYKKYKATSVRFYKVGVAYGSSSSSGNKLYWN